MFSSFKSSKQIALIMSCILVNTLLFYLFIDFIGEAVNNLLPEIHTNLPPGFKIIFISVSGIFGVVGSIIFSGLANSSYRNNIFYYSIVALSITSLGCAFFPIKTNLAVVIVLLLLRAIDGMLIGAVLPQAYIYGYNAVESGKRVLTTCLITLADAGGVILSLLFVMLFDKYSNANGWRIGMLICGFCGIILSYQLKRMFFEKEIHIPTNYAPLLAVFKNSKFTMLRLLCFVTFITSGISVFIYTMPDILADNYGFQRSELVTYLFYTIISFISGLVLSIKFNQKLGKKFYLISGIGFKFWLTYAFNIMDKHNPSIIILLCCICTFVFGVYFAKLPVMIISSFPKSIRYIGVAIVLNIGFTFMYSMFPYVLYWMAFVLHIRLSPAIYIIFFSYLSIISLWFMPKNIFNIQSHSEHKNTGKSS